MIVCPCPWGSNAAIKIPPALFSFKKAPYRYFVLVFSPLHDELDYKQNAHPQKSPVQLRQ